MYEKVVVHTVKCGAKTWRVLVLDRNKLVRFAQSNQNRRIEKRRDEAQIRCNREDE